MTNKDVLAITKSSTKNRPISLPSDAGFIAWTAESTDGSVNYVAFVTSSSNPAATASVTFTEAGLTGKSCTMTDLWAGSEVHGGAIDGTIRFTFPASTGKGQYQSGLFSLTDCK